VEGRGNGLKDDIGAPEENARSEGRRLAEFAPWVGLPIGSEDCRDVGVCGVGVGSPYGGIVLSMSTG